LASVTVSVWVVVTEGEAVGEQLLALDNPVAGVHEQFTPPDPVNGVEPPGAIEAEPEATAVGSGRMVTVVVAADDVQLPTVIVTL
jgi:hypothetical protein